MRDYLLFLALGIYECETPHSFSSGCAITMALSGSAENAVQVMRHISWFGKSSAEYYSRMHTMIDSGVVASKRLQRKSRL